MISKQPYKSMQKKSTETALAWTQGVIDTVYASFGALRGQGDGRVYHNYPLGSDAELAWQSACQHTAQRLMAGAMLHNELRSNESRN